MAQIPFDEAFVTQITRRVIERLGDNSIRGNGSPMAAHSSDKMLVPANISVRHVHLTPEHVGILYGAGKKLEVMRDLYQTGEFASKQTLTLVGPRMRCMGEVRVLGPERTFTQVEVSKTDAIFLGIDPPVNRSGDHAGSVGLTLVGPVGIVQLQRGVIRANRHIHVSADSAQKWGLTDNQTVQVRITNDQKSTLLENVQIRVSELFKDEMHLDTDDGNACNLTNGDLVEIIK